MVKTEDAPRGANQESIVMEITKTSRPADKAGVEVNFKVRLIEDQEASLQTCQWRVEREDRAILMFYQAQEFQRMLPPGRYQIQVRGGQNGNGPVFALQSGLDVTREAVMRR